MKSGTKDLRRIHAEKLRIVTRSLASQARHEMGAPVELFAGAKRGRKLALIIDGQKEGGQKA